MWSHLYVLGVAIAQKGDNYALVTSQMVAPLNACMRDWTWFNRDTIFWVVIQTVLFQKIAAAGKTWSWHSTCKRNAFFKAVWSILFDCLSMYSFYNSLILQLCVQTELYKVGTMGYRVCDTRSADLTNHTTEQIISSGTHWWTTGRIVGNPVDWDVSLAYVTCVLYVFVNMQGLSRCLIGKYRLK